MHIPDGFLDAKTCAATSLIAAPVVGYALRRVSARWDEKTVPLLGVMSAFVFAGQMVNFPVAGATSGHLFGGVLAAIFLGPFGAMVVLSAVLIVQAFLFQDGGVTALGANFINLGLLGAGGGCILFGALRSVLPSTRTGFLSAAAVAAVASILLAAAGCAFQLAASGTISLRLILAPLLAVHLAIGLCEALITVGILSFVLRVRPDLVYDPALSTPPAVSMRTFATYAGLITAGILLLLAPLSSSFPDGLEAVAEQLHFASHGEAGLAAPLPDYTVPVMPAGWLATSLAGIVGTLIALGVTLGVLRCLRHTRSGR